MTRLGTRKFKYDWNGDIWAIHLEARNNCDCAGSFVVDFSGTGHCETFTLGPGEAMRYNFSRHSASNTAMIFEIPAGIELGLFENLDRAFYTSDPSGQGSLKEI